MHTTRRPHSRTTFSQLHYEFHDRLLSSMTAMVKDREAAKDITATAFAKALENIHQFRGRSSLYTWIHAIAANESRRWWRHRRPEVSLDSFCEPLQAVEPPQGEDILASANDIERLRTALRQLPTIYRNVLKDRVIRGYSVNQVARHRRIPLGTVLSRIFKAKQLLRHALK